MRSHPVLARLALASVVLALAGCYSGPSSGTLRRGKLIRNDSCAACCAAKPAETTAPVAAEPAPATTTPAEQSVPAAAEPAPVVVTTPAVTAPAEPAPVVVAPVVPPPAPAAPEPGIVAVRDGGLVRLSWVLPESASGFRGIEIMRNNQEQASGRTRVRAVRSTVTQLEDNVPDAAKNYWYWLKLTHVDGTVENLGPYGAPVAN